METDQKALAVAMIALLMSIGAPVVDRTMGDVLENELADYYICSITDSIQEFKGGISGTGYSGYPFTDSRAGAVRCGTTDNKGEWKLLADYAAEIGMDPYSLLVDIAEWTGPENQVRGKGTHYKCYSTPKGCELLV